MPFEHVGCSIDMVIPPAKAAAARAEMRGQSLTEAGFAQYGPGWVMHTKFMLFFVAEISLTALKPSSRGSALHCLMEILRLCLHTDGDELLSALAKVHPDDSHANCARVYADGLCNHQREVLNVVFGLAGNCADRIAGLLVQLVKSMPGCKRAQAWLSRSLDAVALVVDRKVAFKECPSQRATPEGIRAPRGEKRVRRVDEDLTRFLTTDALRSGQHRSAAKANRATGILSSSTAKDQEAKYMSQYVWATRGSFANSSLLYIVNDDIRVGGEKNQYGVAWSHENQVAAWLLPQDSFGEWGGSSPVYSLLSCSHER